MHITSKGIEVPFAQDLKLINFASKPEQPGLSSSIHLEVVSITSRKELTQNYLSSIRVICSYLGFQRALQGALMGPFFWPTVV